MESVPAFASDSIAHVNTIEGASPGRQLPPDGLLCGAISLLS
jgi:hypothetical protein